jgi:valyl-tRNA synthetase
LEDLKILIPLEGLIDAKEEELRLTKKIAKLTQEKEMLNKKLENKSFIANAPEDLVATQKNRYEVLSKELDNLSEQMIEIQKLI